MNKIWEWEVYGRNNLSATGSKFTWFMPKLLLVTHIAFIVSILFKTSCYEFQEHLNNPLSASLTVANKSDERCTWNMRKLLHLQKHAIVYKTNNMACAGGQVTFETDYRKFHCWQQIVFRKWFFPKSFKHIDLGNNTTGSL